MGFKIVKELNTEQMGHEQTLIVDTPSKRHFVVSSISNGYADETYIFQSDENGDIENWCEVYGVTPRNHKGVLYQLLTNDLTILDFYTSDL